MSAIVSEALGINAARHAKISKAVMKTLESSHRRGNELVSNVQAHDILKAILDTKGLTAVERVWLGYSFGVSNEGGRPV